MTKFAAKLQSIVRDQGAAWLVFAAVTLAFTWPTARDFASRLVSDGNDARHNLWILWHTQQALAVQQPLFGAPLLYYPTGISLLVHAVGPIEGLFALPFWPLGPVAAYNGAILIGFWLTGYGMYALARHLNLARSVAVFAGLTLMAAEMHQAGLQGHIEKTFIGLLPIIFLCVHNALDPRRHIGWVIATAVCLLMTVLHTGWQFVLAGLAIGLWTIIAWFGARSGERRAVFKRIIGLVISCGIIVGPQLWTIWQAANNPALQVASNLQSATYQPDLAEFFAPNRYSWLIGAASTDWLAAHGVKGSIETTVAVAYTVWLLSVIALLSRERRVWRWLGLAVMCTVFALGPTLKVLGQTTFTEYQLPLALPYAWITALPGLDFMRTPGHFMLLGFVGWGIVAGLGLDRLIKRWPSAGRIFIGAAIALLLIESWPQAWSQETLWPVPPFYQQLANDPETYGVFDLPIRPTSGESYVTWSQQYQIEQMTHRKGIASGYL